MSDRRLTPELLLSAYANGIFPMAETRDAKDLYWVDPRNRGVMPLDAFHVSRSLKRRMAKGTYSATLNHDLDAVLDGCSDRDETWINETIRRLIRALFNDGYAHTLEVWNEGQLVGGVYGIALGGAFFGESMFSKDVDGSKIALTWLVDHLRRTGFTLFDTQFITPHLASLGAVEIPRDQYRAQLARALAVPVSFHAQLLETDVQAVLQRMTQTS